MVVAVGGGGRGGGGGGVNGRGSERQTEQVVFLLNILRMVAVYSPLH